MKKNVLAFLLICFVPFWVLAQGKLSYEVSKPYKVIDGAKFYIALPNSPKTLSLKRYRKTVYIQIFDSRTMKEVVRNQFDDFPKGYALENVKKIGSKLYCFFSVWDKTNLREQLFAREIDFETAKFIGKEKKILSVSGKASAAFLFEMKNSGTGYKFNFLQSFDNQKLLVQYRKNPKNKRDATNYDVIGMYIFDENLEQEAGNEITMPYTEKKMNVLDYHINSEGTPFILAQIYKDNTTKETRKIRKKEIANYKIELFKVDITNQKMRSFPVSFEDYLIKDIWLYDDPNNDMLIAGFYRDKLEGEATKRNKKNSSDGLFVTKVTNDGEISNSHFYKISTKVLNAYSGYSSSTTNTKKKKKKAKNEFSSLKIRDIKIKKDGNIFITAEQYYVTHHTDSRGNTHYIYHYDDILISKINPDGKMAWIKKLPKKQRSGTGQSTAGLGFKHLFIKDYQYFVFLDNVKNIDLPLYENPALHIDRAGGYLTAYKVEEETGKVTKVSIFDTKKIKTGQKVYQFSPERILPLVDSEEFIIEFYKKKKEDIMIKVKLE